MLDVFSRLFSITGNMVLGKFGMSTNDFALEQDPATGSYSIQYKGNSSSSAPPPNAARTGGGVSNDRQRAG